jgi:hypothetical protein
MLRPGEGCATNFDLFGLIVPGQLPLPIGRDRVAQPVGHKRQAGGYRNPAALPRRQQHLQMRDRVKTVHMQHSETRFISTPRVKAFRRRRATGLYRRAVDVTTAQLDALEERGYLDPDRRGDRADETEAIEMFLRDSLTKSR